MGVALWIASGLVAFATARIIPFGRNRRLLLEMLTSIALAFLAGAGATALDFGGWGTLDWRAGIFCFCVSLAGLALMRLAGPRP